MKKEVIISGEVTIPKTSYYTIEGINEEDIIQKASTMFKVDAIEEEERKATIISIRIEEV